MPIGVILPSTLRESNAFMYSWGKSLSATKFLSNSIVLSTSSIS